MTGPIRLHPENPRYFLYRGKPLVLITATEHYGAVINRNFDYLPYLDDMVEKRHTLSRCFLLFRELSTFMPGGPTDNPLFGSSEGIRPVNPHSPCKPLPGEYVSPFLRTGPGFATDGFPKFDLDQWNPEFLERLHGFLGAAQERGIIVELTLFSSTYMDAVWNLNPLNNKNNINGVGDIDWPDYISMRDAATFQQQVKYACKIVQAVNDYDNVYFEICNEPLADYPGRATFAEVEAWQAGIRRLIRSEEAAMSKQHLIFQCPTERNLAVPVAQLDTPLEPVVNEPEIDAITVHDYHSFTYNGSFLPPVDRFMQGDLRLERIKAWWTAFHPAAKPVVFDEDNSASNTLTDFGWTVHRKRAWATVCSGGHYNMIDFSIQVGGQETGTPASQGAIRSWLKHLSTFIHNTNFIHMRPVNDLVREVPKNTVAMALASPGSEYVIYLADSREKHQPGAGESCSGVISFVLPGGSYVARLFDPESGQYSDRPFEFGIGKATIDLPDFHHDLVLHVISEESGDA